MLRTALRRAVTAISTIALATVASLAIGISPAHAAPSGYILTKGIGSVYSHSEYQMLGVVAGGAAKPFYFKIVNSGLTSEQFKVVLSPNPSTTSKLYKGSTLIPTNTYYTPHIAPGGSLVLNVKIQVPAGTPQGVIYSTIDLRDPGTNVQLDSASPGAAVAAPASGTTRNDLFVKSGSQPFVGGSASDQIESSSAIKVGATATFTVRLKNDGATPAAITVGAGNLYGCPQIALTSVKFGTKDVTQAVLSNTYSTGVLQPGAKQDLTAKVKRVSAGTCIGLNFALARFTATGADGSITNYGHIPFAV